MNRLQSEILEIYSSILKYELKDYIQEIDFEFNIDDLRKEIFDLIIENDHGFNQVAIKGMQGTTQWEDNKETQLLYDMGFVSKGTGEKLIDEELYQTDKFTEWHPGLKDNSYIKQLTPLIEGATGLNIASITLAWSLPGSHQPMHSDIETLRLHIPVLTNDDIWFLSGKKAHFMDYGKLYHLLAISDHAIINYGVTPRLHVIFSTYPNQDISEKLKQLGQLGTMKENIFSSVVSGGIDKYSMSKLLKIHLSKKNKNLSAKHNKDIDKKWIDVLKIINERLREK